MNLATYAKSQLSIFLGVDISGMADADVQAGVESLMLGGWQRMTAEFADYIKSTTRPETPSPVQIRLMAAKALGVTLSEYDEVLECDLSGKSRRVLVVAFATVERKARLDRVVAKSLQINIWTKNAETGKWDLSRTEVPQDADETFHRTDSINTPERDAAQREQVETCYRPGTSNAPMDGWVRRLNVSHKEAHSGESFPRI